MNERMRDLLGQALDKAVPYTWTTLDQAEIEKVAGVFAQLVATDIIALIRLHMPRNGVNSPENTMSKQHIDNIARVHGVSLPLNNQAYESIIAGADQMAGDGGYREVSLKTPEFLELQARHHALYQKKD